MVQTLLTGFGPFGAVVNNPSARIVTHFDRAGAPGHALGTQVLPVSYARAAHAIRDLLTARQFDAALLLGVAAREPQLRLEQFGRWQPGERPDGDGQVPAAAARPPGALDQYRATVELAPLLDELTAAGFSARLSEDAGRYVCNHTYYAALHTIAVQAPSTRCLFLHVPADLETFGEPYDGPTMALEQQLTAVDLILGWLGRLGPVRS